MGRSSAARPSSSVRPWLSPAPRRSSSRVWARSSGEFRSSSRIGSTASGVTQFVKSHALGNDSLVLDPRKLPFDLTADKLRLVCDRHLGIGSDGILAPDIAGDADFGVRIFNPDGTPAEKSGNGVRIFAKYLRDHGFTDRDRLRIHTAGGTVFVRLELDDGRVSNVAADLGSAPFGSIEELEIGGGRGRVAG